MIFSLDIRIACTDMITKVKSRPLIAKWSTYNGALIQEGLMHFFIEFYYLSENSVWITGNKYFFCGKLKPTYPD